MSFRKHVRRHIARPSLQRMFRLLYRVALAGMNYGGAGSERSAGDSLALRWIASRSDHPQVVFDVGANVGSYVSQALRLLGNDVVVYAFEPSPAAFEQLKKTFGKSSNVHLIRSGVGAAAGSATLWSGVPGSVLASVYVNPINGDVRGEPIDMVTVDDFCESTALERINLLKLDLEGGELDALRGARRLLDRDAIDVIQFEFGQSNLGARTYFIDLFRLLNERYEIYRVLPTGLTRIGAYHETLEVFMSTNYLAVSRSRLGTIDSTTSKWMK